MNYWLIKFAPFRHSWQDILRNGHFEIYSVRNAQARNNLIAMKIGDEVLFYHSQQEKSIMGAMKVMAEAHQDKTTTDPKWVSVTFEPVKTFNKPITLEWIKKQPLLTEIGLVKQPRLSVMKISSEEFNLIFTIGTGISKNI